MSNVGSRERELAAEAFAALRTKNTDRAIPLLSEAVKRCAARTQGKVANDES